MDVDIDDPMVFQALCRVPIVLKGSLNIHLENETYHVWVAFSVVFWCLQFQDLSLVLVSLLQIQFRSRCSMVLNPIQYALKWHSSDGFGGRRWSHSDSVLPTNPSRKMGERKLKKRDRKKAPWSLEMKNDQIAKFGSNLFCGSILGGSTIVLVGYLVHLQFLTCLMTDFKKFHGWSSPRLFPSFFTSDLSSAFRQDLERLLADGLGRHLEDDPLKGSTMGHCSTSTPLKICLK